MAVTFTLPVLILKLQHPVACREETMYFENTFKSKKMRS